VKLPPTPLLPVVQESVNYYRRRIPKTGKKIEIFEEYRAEPVINLNPYLLGWVVENLIRNGIDAIASDSGAITVTVSETSKKVLIDISDTGCGIETKHFRNIFRPGFTTKNRGWGVGLSLAKRIVQDYHNGKISIKESMLDKGTTMRITLPKGD
jgi:signal transduction histidine kinase